MTWDSNLTGKGYEIASSNEGLIRVSAGPGTGKTYSLMRRIWRLLEEENAPEKIFVGTFTRTAATDLKTELENLGVEDTDKIKAGTIHGFCFSIISREGVLQQINRNPRMLMEFEVRFLLEDLKSGQFRSVSKCKKRFKAFTAAWARLQTEEPGWPTDPIDVNFQQILMGWFNFHKCMHIGELVPLALAHLQNNPASPARNFFEHVLIDEYQDLNKSEQAFVDLLAENAKLLVIGDEDQSIYSFKYANPKGIREFADVHPGTVDIPLDLCHRCPKSVVPQANQLIGKNVDRAPSSLQIKDDNPEGEIIIVQWDTMDHEAEGLAAFIKAKIDEEVYKPGEILVLSPRWQFGKSIRDKLTENNIIAFSFFSEKELEGDPKDLNKANNQQAFTLLTLLVNKDDPTALRCWCGFGHNTLAKSQWKRLREYIVENGGAPYEVLKQLVDGGISLRYTDYLKTRFDLLQDKLNQLEDLTGQDLIDFSFPQEEVWAQDLRSLAKQYAPENCSASELYEALKKAIVQPDLPVEVDFVRVMSLHKSKGLTAKLVIIAGCLEGCLPFIDDSLTETEQNASLEEQRRLFYVAMTRPKETLIFSNVKTLPRDLAHKMRVPVFGGGPQIALTKTSRFIHELGPSRPTPITGQAFINNFN